jgi:hypothetical protein
LEQENVARFVGGTTVKPNVWAALVFITKDAAGEFPAGNCTGTLIDFKSILVNGYCKLFLFLLFNYVFII